MEFYQYLRKAQSGNIIEEYHYKTNRIKVIVDGEYIFAKCYVSIYRYIDTDYYSIVFTAIKGKYTLAMEDVFSEFNSIDDVFEYTSLLYKIYKTNWVLYEPLNKNK